ncbi:kinase-like domain-containing protein [Daldinia eschscholtzii]|nr:kinase-like domain-containing protein [Daldinia eschscholtzii]
MSRSSSSPAAYGNKSTADIEAELRSHFAVQHHKFVFGRLLGRGAFGLAFSLIEKLSHNRTRRLVVKRSLKPRGEDDLRNEIEWLKTLRGAEHVVRLLASHDEPHPTTYYRRDRKRLLRRQTALDKSLEGFTGPIAVIEYLENGDLARLYKRLVGRDHLLPNRVIWSFFLCLIRACVGLAYPPNGSEDDPNQLETIPKDGTQPSRIEHADLSAANIMIGTAGGGFQEHDVIPPLKFIDFGRTREGFKGIPDNIRGILRIMVNLIARKEVRISAWITEYQGFETRATEFLHHGNGANYPTLDDEIRDFLARCLAWEEADRMSLQDMLRIAENAVRTKTAAAYPDGTGETDEAIRDLVQQFIYNADT